MLERLMERGKTSGRDDDNVESIKKRFRKYYAYCLPGLKKTGTFVETSMPVVDYYRQHGKVVEASSCQSHSRRANDTGRLFATR
jgi:UMP-CMP kinase